MSEGERVTDVEMVTVPLAALQDLVGVAWSDRWQVIGEFCVGADERNQAKRELRDIVKALGIPQLEGE